MIALHTVGSLGVSAGGPTRTVSALCQNLARIDDVNVSLVSGYDERFGENARLPELKVREFELRSVSQWVKALERCVTKDLSDPKNCQLLLHDHGQWLPINRASSRFGRIFSLPRIVTPRGMLSPWAMGHRRLKKLAAWILFARRDLATANVIHATSQLEAQELRDLGAKNPIAVIPNGVARPPANWITASKKKQVLFLSRLHSKKGVKELVAAWRKISPDGWKLVLAGPDEEDLVTALNLDQSGNISWVGNVEGELKWKLLSESALFILPSYSENFGVAVAESLIAGTPVITTRGTPWQSVVDHGCGWWIDMNPSSIEQALVKAMQTDLHELIQMGSRGHQFANEAFSWPAIAEQMHTVYSWVLNGGETPKCIRTIE